MTMTRIAVAQMRTGIDVQANASALVEAIKQAKAGGAAMLFTPEMSGLLDRDRKRASANIVSESDDRVLAAVRDAARAAGVWVALGSLALRRGDGEKLANRSFVIDDTGAIRARYDKLHLFDVDLPTGESWRESAAYAAGDALSINDTPAGRLGLSVCYDVRFPALYAALSGAGATILAVPAAFTVPTGQAHWHTLLRARAIENACWVVAAAQSGRHEDGRETFGHSLVVDPWGQVMLDMGDDVGVGFAEIDLGVVDAARARIPVIAHRRVIPHLHSNL
jgi:deaminated glutathione amidase